VAFSADGRHLATAGTDRKVCIWRVEDGVLLHYVAMNEPVLSLAWLFRRRCTLLCGSQDGSVSIIDIQEDIVHVNGTWAHACPVERLAVQPSKISRVASGAHHELFIWTIEKGTCMPRYLDVPPTHSLYSKDRGVVVTGLHWMKSDQTLVVTYMYHGIVIFDTRTWAALRALPLHSPIVDASVKPDGKQIVISNAASGFDVYNLISGEPEGSMATEGGLRAVPVLFIHGGNAVVSGSTIGDVILWDVKTC
ncbi:WD40-repeat-containing domain protein, partial [Trametes meyenii]